MNNIFSLEDFKKDRDKRGKEDKKTEGKREHKLDIVFDDDHLLFKCRPCTHGPSFFGVDIAFVRMVETTSPFDGKPAIVENVVASKCVQWKWWNLIPYGMLEVKVAIQAMLLKRRVIKVYQEYNLAEPKVAKICEKIMRWDK